MPMTLCLVARTFSPSCPAATIARSLAGSGHEVHLILAPTAEDAATDQAADPNILDQVIVHQIMHSIDRMINPFGRIGSRRTRRVAIARRLLDIGPQVVHLVDEADRGIAMPPGAIAIQNVDTGLVGLTADAAMLPDGRFLDRLGRPLSAPGVPRKPSGIAVEDGIDPLDSDSHWRVLTYLASIDQVRREHRIRIDRGRRSGRRPLGVVGRPRQPIHAPSYV